VPLVLELVALDAPLALLLELLLPLLPQPASTIAAPTSTASAISVPRVTLARTRRGWWVIRTSRPPPRNDLVETAPFGEARILFGHRAVCNACLTGPKETRLGPLQAVLAYSYFGSDTPARRWSTKPTARR
jgi:hypothetical protein